MLERNGAGYAKSFRSQSRILSFGLSLECRLQCPLIRTRWPQLWRLLFSQGTSILLHKLTCWQNSKCWAIYWYTDIAKFAGHLPHRYGNSRAIWDRTVLPATRQRWRSRLYPSRSWYSIKRPRRDARLSWPSWLVTVRDGIPARRRSPGPVVTGPDVC